MKKEILAIKAEEVHLEPGLSHRPALSMATLTTGINQAITTPQNITKTTPIIVKIDNGTNTPVYGSFLNLLDGAYKKLTPRAHDTLMNIIASNLWANVKSSTIEDLNELRKNPVPNISAFAREWKTDNKEIRKSLDIMTRELNGLGYLDEKKKRFIYYLEGLDLEDPEKCGYLKPIFSMTFMEDLKKSAFITMIPKEVYPNLTILERTLDRFLRNNARIQWEESNPEEYFINVEKLFMIMNRPAKDPNRRDRERIQRPFIKELRNLFEKGVFEKEPFFRINGTKKPFTLTAVEKDGTKWKDILKMDLVYKIPPPGIEETRLKNLAFKEKRAKAMEAKKKNAKEANIATKTIKTGTVKTTNPLEENMDFIV